MMPDFTPCPIPVPGPVGAGLHYSQGYSLAVILKSRIGIEPACLVLRWFLSPEELRELCPRGPEELPLAVLNRTETLAGILNRCPQTRINSLQNAIKRAGGK